MATPIQFTAEINTPHQKNTCVNLQIVPYNYNQVSDILCFKKATNPIKIFTELLHCAKEMYTHYTQLKKSQQKIATTREMSLVYGSNISLVNEPSMYPKCGNNKITVMQCNCTHTKISKITIKCHGIYEIGPVKFRRGGTCYREEVVYNLEMKCYCCNSCKNVFTHCDVPECEFARSPLDLTKCYTTPHNKSYCENHLTIAKSLKNRLFPCVNVTSVDPLIWRTI